LEIRRRAKSSVATFAKIAYKKSMNIKSLGLFLIYLAAALFIMSLIQSPGFINDRAGVIAMADFSAHKPFVYRALIPVLIRGIESITPRFIIDTVNGALSEFLLNQSRTANLPIDKTIALTRSGYRVVVFEILNLAFLLGFLYCLRGLSKNLILFSSLWSDIISLGIVVALPIYFNYGNFMYDFAALFFFSFGLILLYKQNWKWYLPIFGLAVFNKETAILLTAIYAIFYYKEIPKKQYWRLLIIQAFIFVVIKAALALIFASNPGHAIEWHLWRNLAYLSDIANYFRFDPIGVVPLAPAGLNIPLPRGINLVMIALVGFLVFFGWRDKPRFLQLSLIIVPIFFVIGMLNGHIDELRSYIEILPVVYLLAIGGIAQIFGERNRSESE
jgi:hypothetical protein